MRLASREERQPLVGDRFAASFPIHALFPAGLARDEKREKTFTTSQHKNRSALAGRQGTDRGGLCLSFVFSVRLEWSLSGGTTSVPESLPGQVSFSLSP